MEGSTVRGDFAEKLQEMILQELRKTHSEVVIAHWRKPKNWGIMNNADGYGKITGPCGDTMEVSIRVRNDIIVQCTYDTDGCGTSIACGSVITVIAKGKTIASARRITQKQVLQFCDGLPEEDQHCALLAADTLHKAIVDYETSKNEAWRRLYRKT
jgi:nitrogen fixation NifU-like protein